MLTECFFTIMTRHRPEPSLEYWTLLHLLPIMQHESILQRTLDLLSATGNYFFVVRRNGLFKGFFIRTNTLHGVKEVRNVADAVVEALAAVCKADVSGGDIQDMVQVEDEG
jgi:hypothetical protein